MTHLAQSRVLQNVAPDIPRCNQPATFSGILGPVAMKIHFPRQEKDCAPKLLVGIELDQKYRRRVMFRHRRGLVEKPTARKAADKVRDGLALAAHQRAQNVIAHLCVFGVTCRTQHRCAREASTHLKRQRMKFKPTTVKHRWEGAHELAYVNLRAVGCVHVRPWFPQGPSITTM